MTGISAAQPKGSVTDIIRDGLTGAPQSYSQGGTQSSGTITFANIQTAGETITLNGIWVEYTAAASDATAAGTEADPLLVQIKASLELSLDETTIVLNDAGAPAAISVATYTNSATVLTITYDSNTTTGNTYTLVSSGDTVSAATLTGGQNTPDLLGDSENQTISLTQAGDQDFTIGSGSPFQRRTIALELKSGAGNAVISIAAFTDGSTVTLDTKNDYVQLQWIVDAWKVVGTSVSTIA